jgi:hypothetical protein
MNQILEFKQVVYRINSSRVGRMIWDQPDPDFAERFPGRIFISSVIGLQGVYLIINGGNCYRGKFPFNMSMHIRRKNKGSIWFECNYHYRKDCYHYDGQFISFFKKGCLTLFFFKTKPWDLDSKTFCLSIIPMLEEAMNS